MDLTSIIAQYCTYLLVKLISWQVSNKIISIYNRSYKKLLCRSADVGDFL